MGSNNTDDDDDDDDNDANEFRSAESCVVTTDSDVVRSISGPLTVMKV